MHCCYWRLAMISILECDSSHHRRCQYPCFRDRAQFRGGSRAQRSRADVCFLICFYVSAVVSVRSFATTFAVVAAVAVAALVKSCGREFPSNWSSGPKFFSALALEVLRFTPPLFLEFNSFQEFHSFLRRPILFFSQN